MNCHECACSVPCQKLLRGLLISAYPFITGSLHVITGSYRVSGHSCACPVPGLCIYCACTGLILTLRIQLRSRFSSEQPRSVFLRKLNCYFCNFTRFHQKFRYIKSYGVIFAISSKFFISKFQSRKSK